MIQAKECLPLEGAFNVRELGGYPVFPGGNKKYVKQGLIFRSGELSGLTPGDLQYLENRNIKTIVDFRAEEEKKSAPGKKPATVTLRKELPIDAGNLMGALSPAGEWLYNPSAEGAEAEMIRLYAALPKEAVPRYRELFALLAEKDNAPILFHCSAGKDRTGLASALILHALGAGRETVMADYLASAEHLESHYAPYIETRPAIIPYMTVRKEYIQTAFAEIEKSGGLDRYICEELGADVRHLQELYTE